MLYGEALLRPKGSGLTTLKITLQQFKIPLHLPKILLSMTNYRVNLGEELWVEPLGIPNATQLKGEVAEVTDNGFILSFPHLENPFSQGTLLFLRPARTEEVVGWGLAKDIKQDGQQARVFLQNPVWETPPERRARRVPGPYWAHVNYLCASEGHSKARKTVGQLINLSISGVRIRLRSSVKVGEPVLLKVYIGEDKSFEAIGRVVRVVPGAETATGGFEVGVCFVRILRGYPELLEAVGALGLAQEEGEAGEEGCPSDQPDAPDPSPQDSQEEPPQDNAA